MIPKIEKFSIVNYISLFSFFLAIVSIIVKSLYSISTDPPMAPSSLFDFSNIPLSFGVFSLAYDINGLVTEVHASMINKSQFP